MKFSYLIDALFSRTSKRSVWAVIVSFSVTSLANAEESPSVNLEAIKKVVAAAQNAGDQESADLVFSQVVDTLLAGNLLINEDVDCATALKIADSSEDFTGKCQVSVEFSRTNPRQGRFMVRSEDGRVHSVNFAGYQTKENASIAMDIGPVSRVVVRELELGAESIIVDRESGTQVALSPLNPVEYVTTRVYKSRRAGTCAEFAEMLSLVEIEAGGASQCNVFVEFTSVEESLLVVKTDTGREVTRIKGDIYLSENESEFGILDHVQIDLERDLFLPTLLFDIYPNFPAIGIQKITSEGREHTEIILDEVR